MCGRRQNYDSFWFILDGHDDKVKDQCHGAIMKLKRSIKFQKQRNQATNRITKKSASITRKEIFI